MSDHFPVFVSLCSPLKMQKQYQKITIHKRVIHDTNLMTFKTDLHNGTQKIITQKQIQNTKDFLKYSLSYTKNTFP